MYTGGNPRTGGSSSNMASTRAPDLLQQIQKEFESVSHQTAVFKAERDEIERKRELVLFCWGQRVEGRKTCV